LLKEAGCHEKNPVVNIVQISATTLAFISARRQREGVECPQIFSSDVDDLWLLGTFGEAGRSGYASIGAGPESWMAGA
jgi:hypothetical protein